MLQKFAPFSLFMAALYQFPIFQFLGTRKFFSVHLTSPHYNSSSFCSRNNPEISVSSTHKPRANRKVKSKVELANDLREFISMAGLPLDHVPSTKELSEHGRQDLANIVRRRGYKFIRELIANHLLSVTIAPNRDGNLEGSEELLVDLEAISAGQNTSSEDLAYAIRLSNEASKVEEETENFFIDKVVSNKVENVSMLCQSTVTNDDKKDDKISGMVVPEPSSCTGPASPDSRSLSEKVDKFIEDGELGNIEDRLFYGVESLDEDHSEDLHIEFGADTEDEISRLKFLLHKKELELTHLKEQIENEKLALSVLQTKAESELSKAQNLILEKDIELHDAENSLSGLKEVEVQFCGEGDTVEVAGSFNGWHHRIKMDIQPSLIDSGQSGSRNYGVWKTALWLYPGVYEIKFIVDGHWKISPQMESISKGPIHNNILRVDK